MRAGLLRQRIDLYEDAAASRDDAGEPIETPRLVLRAVPAAVRELTGRELERARQLVAEATVEVRIRWRADVTSANWIMLGARRLDIGSALDADGRQRELVLLCTEQR